MAGRNAAVFLGLATTPYSRPRYGPPSTRRRVQTSDAFAEG